PSLQIIRAACFRRLISARLAKSESRTAFLRPAALLILLPAAAGTGIIPPDLVSADDLLHRLHLAGAGHARLLQLATLAALEGFVDVVHRGDSPRRSMRRASVATRGSSNARGAGSTSARSAIGRTAAAVERSTVLAPFDHLHQIQVADRLLLEALHHRLE